MGVQGLWSLVGPAARPTKLETLCQKKIAVDASIWIHQFMRTMRDKEGNALRNGHLLGFFRRICKLLFFNIKPVFVFDGGAPTLKRATIRERRKRREGVATSLKSTARKILSAQAKSRFLMQEEKRRRGEEENDQEENYTYVEELENTAAMEALRKKRKMDQFELPEIQTKDADARLDKIDPRLATDSEIRDFVSEFAPGELDINSEVFQSLPPEIQYEYIQDLTWKSRQTSWARLDHMVRSSNSALDFSKNQIKLLKHRNEMTQRMIKMNSLSNGNQEVETSRIAGERGRQYVLYKNEDVKSGLGWKLPGLSAAEPISLDSQPFEETIVKTEPAQEPQDKVKAAIALNPKLAGLFAELLSDEEDESNNEGFEDIEEINEAKKIDRDLEEEEWPLFTNPKNSYPSKNSNLVDDMGAYAEDDDEAIDQVLTRIYEQENRENEASSPKKPKINYEDAISLDPDNFISLWLSKVPDAFIYLHSFNDEYKKIIAETVLEKDVRELEQELKSVRKQFGKTNDRDELTQESLQYQESLLESTIKWKDLQQKLSESQDSSPMIIDDEDEEDILFMDNPIEQRDKDEVKDKDDANDSNTMQDVYLNFKNSRLQSHLQPSTAINNTKPELSVASAETKASPEKSSFEKKTSLIKTAQEAKEIEFVNTEQPTYAAGPIGVANNENNPYLATKELIEQEALQEQIIEEEPELIEEQQPVSQENYGYNSEDEFDQNINGEEAEYTRFVSDIASKHLDQVRNDLYKDMEDLNKQRRKEMGNSDEVSDQMVRDIQELLKLFGIPYIVSPMEAEAQCAELEHLSLIDGTITDDSDVFLFGASRVYKNMFNQQRFVECYLNQDIEREMLLTRKKLIQLAFLLGSDYTDGIAGVGPVAAMEILAEFTKKNEDGEEEDLDDEELEAPLERFRDWYGSGQDNTPFQRKFRKRHSSLDIPDDFPNRLVKDAYYHPTVDSSKQSFEWGSPDLDSLRTFLTEAFGWSEEKADQVLLPVIREINTRKETGEQQSISTFFGDSTTISSGVGNGHKHSSKRVQNIVEKWKSQKKRKSKK